MNQLTIRCNSDELDAALRKIAADRNWSLNQAANYLLLKGAGLLDNSPPPGIGNALDEFIGSWPESEAKAFDQRIADTMEEIDEELWL
ncbi:MAG TPA: hypothetical protein EYQ50_20010 [Verrucomicrobiales bacterium]|nr:hypothetical protein [Verrucomicrobiales bacterium]HIL69872.1 hypothetical protein [Verrucomicrobiota bacterium]